jgi:hypothetical protein
MIQLRYRLDRSRVPPDVATEVGCQLELKHTDDVVVAGSGVLTTNLCLVLDCSASMLGSKCEAMIKAAQMIVNTIDARHRISVVGFATTHWIVVENASPDELGRDTINRQIEKLRDMIKGSTNLGEGIRRGIKLVQRHHADAGVLVVLTDGIADSQADAEQASTEANLAGVQVNAVGIGEGFRADDLLKVVTPSGGALLGARAADRLEAAFAELLQRIESFVATRVQLDITPAPGVVLGAVYKTSPERMSIGEGVDQLIVGNIEHGLVYAFHATLTPPCAGTGEAEIARAMLRYDVPSHRLRGQVSEVSIRISYDAGTVTADPEVVRAQARAQLAALVNQLAASEARGDRAKSTELLALLAERSAALGNTRLAEALRGLTSPIPQAELNALVLAATARDEEPARAPRAPASLPPPRRPAPTAPRSSDPAADLSRRSAPTPARESDPAADLSRRPMPTPAHEPMPPSAGPIGPESVRPPRDPMPVSAPAPRPPDPMPAPEPPPDPMPAPEPVPPQEPPPEPPPPPPPLHELVLVDAGPSVLELMRELRELTGFGLARVHQIIESVPSPIVKLSEVEARAAKQRLEAHGARVTIAEL